MLNPTQLLEIITELNDEIENGIDNLSTIEPLSLQTNGISVIIKLFGDTCWTSEEDEIEGKVDLINILKHYLKNHKTQVDGMLELWKDKEDKEKKFFLDTDGDGHWYLIEADHRKEWEEWHNLSPDDETSWEAPYFAKPINGCPTQIEFII